MNEAIINEMTAISELNRVDGFDPSKFMRKLTEVDENGQPSERMYLEVAYRKLWFRLKHPEGAIRKFIREVNDQFAIMEARVYLDRKDPEESYIANAIVKRYFHPEDKLGDKYLEIAETAAVGRALADAGFGIQFTDSSENPESGVVDSPIGMPMGTPKFIAEDGTEFDHESACKEYEHAKAMEKLACIEHCNELDDSPNFDGGECYESHSYIWYRPKDAHEIDLLNDAYGNSFGENMIGEWICVETDSGDDFLWVTMLDDGINHAKYILDKLGFDVVIAPKEYKLW